MALLSPSVARPAPVRRTTAALPAWPLLVLFWGLPLIWAFGALQFAPALLAVAMLFLLMLRRGTTVPWPAWVLAVFLLWMAASSVQIEGFGSWMGFALRWVNIFAALIYVVYYWNARETLDHRRFLRAAVVAWATLVGLGLLTFVIPEARLTTPIGLLLPEGITSNALVQNYFFPPLAEVQMPWGAPEPYNRPAAPFPYTNGWGSGFVLLTPLVLAYLTTVRFRARHLLIVAGLLASLAPAVATTNRGMFLGITVALGYVMVRMALRGRIGVALAGITGVAAVGGWLVASGAVDRITGRQEYSDSTGTRSDLYRDTFLATLDSPLLGYGAPLYDETVGIEMGTQGYIWTLMFCYGLVGLGLFMAYLHGTTLMTLKVRTTTGLLVHSAPMAACLFFTYYGLDAVQFILISLSLAVLLRSRRYGEGL
ncbi:O-antigen ligase family protein [uncultured Kocuria sp.]|uniref:O-antigen ligase family protein n=1 Tax=uncultured Kocuria sp. TaxID=259305 RepID=UPI00263912B7|nr:O-antigen ligase family protein [uncultured Kocuria sp.]